MSHWIKGLTINQAYQRKIDFPLRNS